MKSTYSSRALVAAALFVVAAAGLSSVSAGAQPKNPPVVATPTPTQVIQGMPTPQPVPSPITSLPPASSPSTFPYPAYGSPAPGVDRGVPVAGVPQTVSLDQAIAIGFARSPLLAQARGSVEIATAPVDLAATAILPNISGTATAGRSFRQPGSTSSTSVSTTTGTTTGTGTGTGTGTSTGTTTGTTSSSAATTTTSDSSSNSVSIALRQLIYDGGKVAAQLRAAKDNQSASLATYKRQLQTVAFNVANAYYAALAAQRQTQVANETVKINIVNENLVAAQIRVGTAARTDLSTAQLPTAQARVTLVRDQGAELSAQAAFVNAMGLDANTYVLPQDDGNVLNGATVVPAVPVPTYAIAIQRALMLRPDYYSVLQTVEGYKASLKAAKLGLFPNLNGTASFGTASSDTGGGSFRNAGSLGLTLTIPIFDQGITHAQTLQAQGQLDQELAIADSTRQTIQLNVKQSLVGLISAAAVFDQTKAELSKAQEVLQSTQAQYKAGVTTLPLLLNAQVGLTQALTDEVTAVYSFRQAEATFLYAEGANAPA